MLFYFEEPYEPLFLLEIAFGVVQEIVFIETDASRE